MIIVFEVSLNCINYLTSGRRAEYSLYFCCTRCNWRFRPVANSASCRVGGWSVRVVVPYVCECHLDFQLTFIKLIGFSSVAFLWYFFAVLRNEYNLFVARKHRTATVKRKPVKSFLRDKIWNLIICSDPRERWIFQSHMSSLTNEMTEPIAGKQRRGTSNFLIGSCKKSRASAPNIANYPS